MTRMLLFGFPPGMLAMVFLLGAPTPVAGVWQGEAHGTKAITLRVRDTGDHVAGTAVFYILQDEGTGEHNGSASGEIAMTDPAWDGHVLRFSIHGPHGESGALAMKLTGANVAELTVEGRDGAIRMNRLK